MPKKDRRPKIHGQGEGETGGRLTLPPTWYQSGHASATEQGLQFTAHVQGDGAVQSLLDAYETVNSRTPIKRLRLGGVMDIQPAVSGLDDHD